MLRPYTKKGAPTVSNGTETSGTLHAADGTRLAYREWLVDNARGAVEIVHGLGEHGGRHAELAKFFNGMGLSVRAHDHRGHGRSDGPRGGLRQPHDLLDDLKLVFDDFSRQQGTMPFLFGHSLGGLVAARFATGGFSAVRGLMLSSPALAISMSLLQRALLLVSTRLAPGLTVSTGLAQRALSHDAAVVVAYQDDTLNHNKITPRVANFMLDAIRHAQADAAHFTRPTLLQVAGSDQLVVPAGSRHFFECLPAGDKTLHWYEDAFHEIFNETPERRERAHSDLSAWLTQQLETAADK